MSSMRLALAISGFQAIKQIELKLAKAKANLESDVALLSKDELAEYAKATGDAD
jgi:hypothetical protein